MKNEAMFSMSAIGERLRTQDNRITADPIFEVQEKKRCYGMDPRGDCEHVWVETDDYTEVDQRKAKRLETRYKIDGNDEPAGYRRCAYVDRWEYVQPFFTEAAAERYIKENGHNHRGELRIYAGSAFRNWEWQAVREFLMSKGGVL